MFYRFSLRITFMETIKGARNVAVISAIRIPPHSRSNSLVCTVCRCATWFPRHLIVVFLLFAQSPLYPGYRDGCEEVTDGWYSMKNRRYPMDSTEVGGKRNPYQLPVTYLIILV